jgi:hypothetical protein
MPDQSNIQNTSYNKELLERIKESIISPAAETKESIDPFQQAKLDDHKSDIELKKKYAHWFIWILLAQLLVMNVVFVAVGLHWLCFDEPSYLQIYMSGTLAEVFGIVFLITKYLFSQKNKY